MKNILVYAISACKNYLVFALVTTLSKLCKKRKNFTDFELSINIFVAKGLYPPKNSLASKAKHI